MTSLQLTESTLPYRNQFDFMAGLGLISIEEDGLPLCVEKGEGLCTSIEDGCAKVTFNSLASLYRGVFSVSRGISGSFTAKYELCGEMIDNSRNSVTTVEKVKEHIAYSAAFGLNCLYLYNEDTFEIEGEPYFGYMRGRYSKAEIKDICDFAAGFGVEVVPCIQTLAHLNQALRWSCYAPIKDFGDTLMADEEASYALIEKMIAAWRSVTDTKHLHIGMDEAFGLCRGKYLDKHGLVDRFELMCRHLERVAEICEKYGFKPMMWSDMFFHLIFGGYYTDGHIDKALMDKVPKNVTLVYWDYYSTTPDKYKAQVKKHALFENELAFAGGAWKWSGFTPAIDHSLRVSPMAFEEIDKKGVKYVMMTCWGDDGADCLSGCVLPVLALYGAYNYFPKGKAEDFAKDDVLFAAGYTTEEFCELCRPSVTPCENRTPYANPTKYLFYNDPLKGLFDKHTTPEFDVFYADCAKDLWALSLRGGPFAYLFEVQAKLCHALELKATLGVKLKAAYDRKDKAELLRLAKELIPETVKRMESFHAAFRKAWLSESKAGGFDTQDIRIGGIIMRMKMAAEMIIAYLDGEADRIEELEEERLYFDCRQADSDKCLTIGMNRYNITATPNIL